MRLLKALALLGCAGLGAASLAARPQDPRPAPAGTPTLAVPDGFDVQRVAGPPLVDRPIVADFDEQGRLYVADSSGSNDKVELQLETRPHRIVRLEDSDGDGQFDTRVVFADRMMLPEGTMWYDGSLYVAAPPSIWKLTDTNGDGVADEREEWFHGHTLTGCANDLHGPYLGPDGYIYWTKGAFAQQTHQRPSSPPLVTRAAHIFRRHPKAGPVEPVMTGGMDNPVDVAFTPGGERIFTATFLEHPGGGKRDAIVHAIYGGVYGKRHSVLDGHPRTGDLMPVLEHLGPAVPAGLTRYDSNAFGAEYAGSFFAAMFNLRKVTRHVLTPSGATFSVRSSDFLVSGDRDFHPTDVVEDADGSLLVLDTGPWYKLCCPTSQLAKPEMYGAIYRVRSRSAPRVDDPRGLRIAWDTLPPEALARLLQDERAAVRNRALHLLGKAGAAAVPPLARMLRESTSAAARREAVWALTRIDEEAARAAARVALADGDDTVRQAALHSAAVRRDAGAVPQVIEALRAGRPAVGRAAAEALGRIGDPRAVRHLVEAAANASDRVLEHSLIFALIEIADRAATLTSAGDEAPPGSRRAALIALDQMPGALAPSMVIPLLDSREPVLRETAWWIVEHRADWGAELAGYFARQLASPTGTDGPAGDALARRLGGLASNAAIQDLLASTASSADASRAARRHALGAMALSRGTLKSLPARWTAVLPGVLASPDAELVRLGLDVLRGTPAAAEAVPVLRAALLDAASDASRPLELRLDALAALPGEYPPLTPDLFELVEQGLAPARLPATRGAAAGVLEKAPLTADQLLALAGSIRAAGPLELPRLVRAFTRSRDEAVGLALVESLERAPARGTLGPDLLRPVLDGYPAAVRARARTLETSGSVDASARAKRLDALLAGLQGGDVRRGQAVFNSDKAACLSCHAVGYIGGTIGPDLTRIGQVRTERDLLEAIVYPSASFARSYEPFTARTKSGAQHAGILRSDGAQEVVLATAAGQEVRLAREEVVELQPGSISLMPPGLDEQLTRQELADLLAFLKALRPGP